MDRRAWLRTLVAAGIGGGVATVLLSDSQPMEVITLPAQIENFGAAEEQAASGQPKTPSPSPTTGKTATVPFDRTEVATEVHHRTNQNRGNHDAGHLEYDTELEDVAMAYAATLADAHAVGHEIGGTTLRERLNRGGVDCHQAGENAAQTWWNEPIQAEDGIYRYDTTTKLAFGLVRQWMHSSGHKRNLLDSRWDSEGIGIATTVEQGKIAVYAVAVFCRQ